MAAKSTTTRSRKAPANVNDRIRASLADGPLSTRQLANALGLEHGSVYGRCRRMEESGILTSKLATAGLLLYCVDDGKVVERSDYETCKEENHDLRAFNSEERIWSLP